MKRFFGKTTAAIGLLAVASAVYLGLYHITLYGFDPAKLRRSKKQSAGNSCRRFSVFDGDTVYAYKIEFRV